MPLEKTGNFNINRLLPLVILSAVVMFTGWLDPFRDHVSDGNQAFHEKKYDEAVSKYNSAEEYAPGAEAKRKLAFNRANADYAAGNYDRAITGYRNAAQSEDKDVQKKAFYNMGNAYVRAGRDKEAVNAYVNALRIDPEYENAKKNIEYLLNKNKNNDNKDQQNKDNKDNSGKDGEQNQKDNEAQKDKNRDDGGNQNQKSPDKRDKNSGLTKEQIENMLKNMQDRPVQRRKGNTEGRRALEKDW